MGVTKEQAIALILDELEQAEIKHPAWPDDPVHASAILNEEAGELTQACLQFAYDRAPVFPLKLEAAQVGAMAIRFIMGLNEYKMKIREAMNQHEQRDLLTGIVEADETYVGGKPRKGSTPPGGNKRGRGTKKIPVVGVVERNGKVKAEVFKNKPMTAKNLNSLVRRNVDVKNSVLMTDAFKGYLGIKKMMPHLSIDHAVWYVNGDIHTNTIESFWALLKRGIIGQYHKVSARHLPKYIDEFCYRWNHNKQAGLFEYTLQRAVRC